MQARQINLLKSLIEIPSPSGFEDDIASFIKTEVTKFVPKSKVQIDFQKNVIVSIPGKTDRTIMIDAHEDIIGWIVTNINGDGLISLAYIGGGYNRILTARHLNILTDKGPIPAVVNTKHAHLVEDEDEENSTIIDIQDVQVDIGIRKRSQVLKYVKIGDPVVLKPQFNSLLGGCVTGYGMDNKAGCLLIIETIKEIVKSKKQPEANLVFVFSSQEETDTKLEPVIREYCPDEIVGIDVTFATDYLWGSETLEQEVGRCELGKGIVLYRGVDIHQPSLQLMTNIANKNKIKVQFQASTGDIGYNASVMTGKNKGIRGLLMAIPLRNMHCPTETVCLKDINYGIKLLATYLLSHNLCRVLEK